MANAPMFARAMGLPARLAVYGLACLVLMIVDSRYDALSTFRTSADTVISPVQSWLARPFEFLGEAGGFFTVHGELLRQNQQLQLKNQQLEGRLQAYLALERENAHLRKLLDLRVPPGTRPLVAEIIRIQPDPFDRRVIIDKGSTEGVQAGRPVVDASGLVGQVTRVYPFASVVSLLTSEEQAAPVMDRRNGLRLIVYGTGSDELLEVRYLDSHADVQPGDVLVTSGIDGTYPLGIPVATVVRVEPPKRTPFAKAICRPIGAIGQFRQVLILNSARSPK